MKHLLWKLIWFFEYPLGLKPAPPPSQQQMMYGDGSGMLYGIGSDMDYGA